MFLEELIASIFRVEEKGNQCCLLLAHSAYSLTQQQAKHLLSFMVYSFTLKIEAEHK
jgi:hypothetical protein